MGTPRAHELWSPAAPAALSPPQVPTFLRPVAPPPSPPSGLTHPSGEPAIRRHSSGLAVRVVAGALAVVVLIAFTMVGMLAWRGGPEAVDRPSPTATRTASSTVPGSVAERPRKARVTAGETPGAQSTPGEPGAARSWELPPVTWDPLPQLEPANQFWTALQQAPLYELAPVSLMGCPQPAVVADLEHYRADVQAQWSCVHAAWVPVYEAMGWSTVEPAVKFFPGSGSVSECGFLEAPAFYCSAGHGTVYFGGDHFQMASRWDLSVNEMVNHEYSHHIQNLASITYGKQQVGGSDEVERRSELQATCWSAMMTYNNSSVDFGQREYDGWRVRLDTMLVDGIHGSRESLQYWGIRGLYAETLGACNTWLVESGHVS